MSRIESQIGSDSSRGCGLPSCIQWMRGFELILLLLVVLAQSMILSFSIAGDTSSSTIKLFVWITVDALVAFLMTVTMYVARRHRNQRRSITSMGHTGSTATDASQLLQARTSPWSLVGAHKTCIGQYPLSYISWFVYSTILAIKICICVQTGVPARLPVGSWNGPPFLLTVVGSSALIFALLVDGHHDAAMNSLQESAVTCVVGYVTSELLDAVSLLGLLFPDSCHSTGIKGFDNYIVGFVDVNLILPTLVIYKLAQCRFGAEEIPLGLKLISRFFSLVAINVPYLAIRSILWKEAKTETAIFVLKNVIFCFVHIRSGITEFREWLRRLGRLSAVVRERNNSFLHHHRSGSEAESQAVAGTVQGLETPGTLEVAPSSERSEKTQENR